MHADAGTSRMRRPLATLVGWSLVGWSLALGLAAVTAAPAASADTLSVLTYGAHGDGVSNDRGPIQRAINAAKAAGGGIVEFPPGHTYLSGNLVLRSGVTLQLDTGAVLQQSQNPAHYSPRPHLGRFNPDGPIFDAYADQNNPFVLAAHAHDVAITGGGTIRMTHTSSDATSVLVHAIGFYRVTTFTISDITVDGASMYNLAIRESDHGTISGVTTSNPSSLNSDGVSVMDSQYIHVHANDLTTMDDGIYVWASWDDPRGGTWWSSDDALPSHDIEVDHNTVVDTDPSQASSSHGFTFINWTAGIPDAQQVEVSRISVHDNDFTAPRPIGALTNDPYHSAPGRSGAKTPTKDLSFHDNTLTSTHGGPLVSDLDQMATTNFSGDPIMTAVIDSSTELLNADFDASAANTYANEFGVCFWSLSGTARASSVAVGQPGGRYGELRALNQSPASIFQGLHLSPGVHTFTAQVQRTSGARVHLFAATADGAELAATPATGTSWQTLSVTFTVGAAGTYRVGLAATSSRANQFGRIDTASLS